MLKYPGQDTIDFDEVRQAAQGRWPEIFDRLCPLAPPVDSAGHRPCACGGYNRLRLDTEPPEAVDAGKWLCSQGTGQIISGNGFDYLLHALGWDIKRAMREVWEIVKPHHRTKTDGAGKMALTLAETYLYKGLDGLVKYAVERYVDSAGNKTFRQYCKPDGETKRYSLKGVPRLPYLLDTWKKPHLGAHPLIYIVEGERDADRLYSLGYRATCNAGGAGNWQDEITPYIADWDPVIIEDNDEAGRRHVRDLIAKYQAAGYKRIRIIVLRDMPEHSDISDYLDAGGRLEDLRRLTVDEYLALDEPEPEPEPEPAQPPIRIISALDFVRGLPETDFLVDDLFQRRYIYSLTAKTGHGKTAFGVYLAFCVATGRDMAGHECQKGRVVFFAGENPDDVRMRIMLAAEAYGIDLDGLELYFIPRAFDIKDAYDTIAEEVERIGGADMIIVDTAAAFFGGEDENSNTQLGNYARDLRALTRLPGGPTVIVPCHPVKNPAKDDLSPRGGGAFLAEVDGNLTLWSDDQTSMTTLHWQHKLRGPGFEPVSFRFEPTTSDVLKDAKGRQIPNVVLRPMTEEEIEEAEANAESDADAVLDVMLNYPKKSLAGWCVELRWIGKTAQPQKSRLHNVLQNLKQDKLVYLYRKKWHLTDKGKREAERVIVRS